MRAKGGFLSTVCYGLAAIIGFLWLCNYTHPIGAGGARWLNNSNTLVIRKFGLAIGSWQGRIAILHVDHQEYRYWHEGCGPEFENIKILGGTLEYQATETWTAGNEWYTDFWERSSRDNLWRFAGFVWESRAERVDPGDALKVPLPIGTVLRATAFAAPDYFLIAILLAFPLYRHWRKHAVSRRGKSGLCENCGYDLRGGHAVCPECGTAVFARATAEEVPESRAGSDSPGR
jgi:hypothetical protein